MKTTLTGLGIAAYFLVGILQLVAMMAGLEYWLGFELHWAVWVFGFPLLLALAELPIIGTIAGITGAVHGWNWTYPWAIAFFCGPYVLYLVAVAVALIFDFMGRRRAARATFGFILLLLPLASPATGQDTQAKGHPNCQLWNGFTYEQKTLFLLGYSQAVSSLGAMTTLHGGVEIGKQAMTALWPAGMNLGDVGDAVSLECKKKENSNRQIAAMIFKVTVDAKKAKK